MWETIAAPPFLLLVSLAMPLWGALVILLTCRNDAASARLLALFFAVATLVAATGVVVQFPTDQPAAQANYAAAALPWLGEATGLDIRFDVAVDGLSLWLYGLSALLVLTAVLISWTTVREREAGYYGLLLLLAGGMLGVFVARDMILFYIFFEFTLIPLFVLIGIWGSDRRRYAAVKFFLFTLAGSLLTFLGLLLLVLQYDTFSIPELTARAMASPLDPAWQTAIFLLLFAGFAIKVPLFPLHTWLPLAHVEAPAAGSVLLAGVLLKIGTYGFLRFSVPLLPEATATLLPWLLWLSVAGIVYGALVALAQSDLKRLIAYSSVSHLGFCMLGLFALNRLGIQGGVLQSINHGISTGGLFAIVGMIYRRYHTREISELGGLARRTPWLAAFMVFFTLSSIGLPGTNGFAGEFLLLCGMFQRASATTAAAYSTQFYAIAVLAVSGVVLGAWYMLWLVQRVFFGPLREPTHDAEPIRDMGWSEFFSLAPLAVFVLWIGLFPGQFLKPMSATLDRLTGRATAAWEQQAEAAARMDAAELADRGQNSPQRAESPPR
ncbi:MAG: NADH-quinone oxidoreductase subunit M [Planctomycetota bacterium]|nr:MAG: NADH-quinone oxidoreductase subunit M [Planctomycetota bacterium]REJ91366.1 MAG: NADH-quinone oxidoreductase subunit M [Planctomycetota bacterium]